MPKSLITDAQQRKGSLSKASLTAVAQEAAAPGEAADTAIEVVPGIAVDRAAVTGVDRTTNSAAEAAKNRVAGTAFETAAHIAAAVAAVTTMVNTADRAANSAAETAENRVADTAFETAVGTATDTITDTAANIGHTGPVAARPAPRTAGTIERVHPIRVGDPVLDDDRAPASNNSKRLIPVMEIFGPTVQGEGMVIGQKTMFVRTAGCDYRCSWCDSAFTWDGSGKRDIRLLTASDIWGELRRIGGDTFAHVTISGGNPGLLPQLGELVDTLHAQAVHIGLETQGSRWQDWFWDIDDLTLSPKPPSSGMSTDWSVLDSIIVRLVAGRGSAHGRQNETPVPAGFYRRNAFSVKVVVFDEADLDYAARVHHRHPHVPFYLQAGNDRLDETDPERLLPHLLDKYAWLVGRVMEHKQLHHVRVLPQLHTWMWGNKKGV